MGSSLRETRVVAVQEARRRHGPVQRGAMHALVSSLRRARVKNFVRVGYKEDWEPCFSG